MNHVDDDIIAGYLEDGLSVIDIVELTGASTAQVMRVQDETGNY